MVQDDGFGDMFSGSRMAPNSHHSSRQSIAPREAERGPQDMYRGGYDDRRSSPVESRQPSYDRPAPSRHASQQQSPRYLADRSSGYPDQPARYLDNQPSQKMLSSSGAPQYERSRRLSDAYSASPRMLESSQTRPGRAIAW
jgi:hypothetical protein